MKTKITLFLFLTNFYALAFGGEHVVVQKNKQFDQSEIKVKIGDTVKFVNSDTTTHHLMFKANGNKVSQKQKSGGEPLIQTFTETQKTTVRCAIHPRMKIKIIVE